MLENKIAIPTKSLVFHQKLKSELLSDFPPILTLQSPRGRVQTPLNTTTLPTSVIRAGYFRPKSKQLPTQSLQVSPNYMKRDPREYPPMHCCVWRPKSITGEADIIESAVPRTKHVHHTLFDAGRYDNARESPTIMSVNKVVFRKSNVTPINLLSTDSIQLDQFSIGKQPLLTEPGEQNEENPLQTSLMSISSKLLSPTSSKGFGEMKELRRSVKVDSAKVEKFKEKFESTQKEFKKVQLRIDEVARKKRGWYQDNMNETTEVKDKIQEGSLLLGNMYSSHHKEEMRLAVRLSKVHSRYEKSWNKLGPVSSHKDSERLMRSSHSRLRKLINENSHELDIVFNTKSDQGQDIKNLH